MTCDPKGKSCRAPLDSRASRDGGVGGVGGAAGRGSSSLGQWLWTDSCLPTSPEGCLGLPSSHSNAFEGFLLLLKIYSFY